ncbi:AMP-binding protein [Methylococcus capsulatus]|uniref:AMP-binding protein n=1 Tax=Methylococcus capsulatus TaxID=414 RepID=UPI001C52D695|nr:AMP-binding protein [Methylococcus capsulatus]QXP86965.1 AMP-binding protein [Methylococcus capsulatus]QXP93355.1 AMP-binding protein [Methylococcus capsulatus]UQN11946.1 AMP-binding protein [Methylococcus capsulatus]
MIKPIIRLLLKTLYRVQVKGIEHFHSAGPRVLIVSNHTSFLDPILLWAFLPDEITFAINTRIAESWWVKPALRWVRTFPMDPTNPMSVKTLTHHLRRDRKAVVFPEGRITVTGSLMKIYDGSGLVADKAGAAILPVRIDGAQYTPFSRLKGVVRLRWLPPISINILPPRTISPPTDAQAEERRRHAGLALSDIMSEMMFATGNHRGTLFSALLDARKVHGGKTLVLEDVERKPVSYDRLIARALFASEKLECLTETGETVGILLPTAIATVVTLLGLQHAGRIPAMLNFSTGVSVLRGACETAAIRTVLTSRRFIDAAKLGDTLAQLESGVRVIYLEEVFGDIPALDKLRAFVKGRLADYGRRDRASADSPAVILFTSGSEGPPKGVALSHANLLSNREQFAARVDFGPQDVILNALPLFHSFGLTTGTLLPLLSGTRVFLYPSPLHYRIIPEVAYDINATILFGTNTFLYGYGKHAHPYDFYSIRYVFAGAEKVQPETRRLWADKFGIRIMEGYGVTETSPVLAANTAMHYREGTVGRLMPGIEYALEPVEGIADGGRLHVKGPNVMLGYLHAHAPGRIEPPASCFGPGWYDTGDIVSVDEHGYVTIKGRAKRFAKIGGEMISLAVIEELASRVWPDARHAAVSLPDPRKGEQIVLATDQPLADRTLLFERARTEGLGELYLPKRIRMLPALPLLGSGKIDYPALTALLAAETGA